MRIFSKPRVRFRRAALAGVSLTALLPALALAQGAPPPTPVTNAPALQDVTITARHRVERAQSVPVSLTTISQKQIQALNTLNLNTIKQLVPTLTINAYNPRNIGLDIRGLGSVGFFGYDGLEGGVGIYIDGVLLGRSTESNFDLPDIADVEVLRGPQGTLFGKNTVSGAVNINTKVPSFKPEAEISVSYGNYKYWKLEGYATSALGNSDKAAVSFSFHAEQHNGYTKDIGGPGNPNNGATYNNQDDKGLRAQLLLQPNSNLTVRIIANYDHSDANCCITIPFGVVTHFADGDPYSPATASPTGTHPYISAINRFAAAGYTLPTINPFGRTTDINSWNHYAIETAGLTALIDYNLDGYTISSITGASYYNWYPHLDADGTGGDFLTAGNNTTHQRQFSQEFRLTSPLGGAVDYTTGLYGFYQQLNDQALSRYGTQAAADFTGLNAASPGTTYTTTQAALNGFASAATDIPSVYSTAAYGQATWHITPQLDLTGGARLTYEEKFGTYYEVQEGGENLATSGLTPAEQATAQATRNAYSPITAYSVRYSDILPGGLVTLSYKPEPNILTYLTYSHGEKSAGINFTNGLPNAQGVLVPRIVAPEKIDNYEIGAKTTLLNGRLLLNGDAFWDEDTNFQSTIFGLVGNTPTAYLANVPKVRSRGLETDIHAQVTNNFTVFSSAVFDEAYNESNPASTCPIEVTNVDKTCDLTGRPIAGASRWNADFGGEYDYPLPEIGNTETTAYLGGDVELRSFFYSTADDGQYSKVPGYGLANLDFGIRQADGRWDLSGWIHNATNEHYYLFKEVQSSTGTLPTYNLVLGEVGDPLTFGVTLRAKFE
jgi:iron complex outermembrane receptor protein